MIRLIFNFLFRTKRRSLTVKAVFYAAYARIRIYFFPGSKLYRYLGEHGSETPVEEITDPELRRNFNFVSNRVFGVARRMPWESKCLVQAMVAQRLLRGYNMKSTLYLGVGRDEKQNGKMIAHAWVRCGDHFVCGGNGEGYAVVAKFTM